MSGGCGIRAALRRSRAARSAAPAHEQREADGDVAGPRRDERAHERRAAFDDRGHAERDRGCEEPERPEHGPRDGLPPHGEGGEHGGEDRADGEQRGERRAEREREER
jgi:hypothetical protein